MSSLDRHARGEHVAVAQVSVVRLDVQVELAQPGIVHHGQSERVVRGSRGGVGPFVAAVVAVRRARLGAVEEQPGLREHGHRCRAEPPVDQIEVVARLVHQQAARVGLVAVPAAEVVGAVAYVQQPLEVHRADLADLPRGQPPADLLVHRVEAVVESYRDGGGALPFGEQDPPGPVRVGGHRLFGDHVSAGGQRGHDVLVVGGVDGGHQHHVNALLVAASRRTRWPGRWVPGRARAHPATGCTRPSDRR